MCFFFARCHHGKYVCNLLGMFVVARQYKVFPCSVKIDLTTTKVTRVSFPRNSIK